MSRKKRKNQNNSISPKSNFLNNVKLYKKKVIPIIGFSVLIIIGSIFGFYKYNQSPYAKYEAMSIFEYIKETPENELSVTIAGLILSKEVYPEITFEKYFKQLDLIANRVNYYVKDRTDPDFRIAAMNTTLFRYFNFHYDKTDYMAEKFYNHILSSILDRKTGVCTSLPMLYICVAERLNYPVYAVSAPNHVFCRYVIGDMYDRKNGYINIEATGGGGFSPDVFYIDDLKIPIDSYRNGVYLRTLTKREYIGYMIGERGVFYGKNHNYENAIKYFIESVRLYPKFSSGYKNLSITYNILAKNVRNEFDSQVYGIKADKYLIKAESLGIAPKCPPYYWETDKPNDKSVKKNVNGFDTEAVPDFEAETKKLEEKYREYFQ